MAVCWSLLSMIIFDVPFSGLPLVWLNVSPAACPKVRKQQPLGDAKKHMWPFIHCFLAYLLLWIPHFMDFFHKPILPSQRQKRFSRVAGGSVYTNDVAWCLHKLYATMHTLFAQYMLCPTQLNSSASSGWVYFSQVSHASQTITRLFFCLALGRNAIFLTFRLSGKIGSGSTWMNAQSYHIFGWEFLRWWDICWSGTWWSHAGGEPFFSKSDRKKMGPKNMDHLMITML